MSNMCLIVTPSIRKVADEIRQQYPEACSRNGFNDQLCADWIGLYNNTNSKSPDFIPSMKSIVSFIEKIRNKEGKSFLRDLESERQQAYQQEIPVELQREVDDEYASITAYDSLKSSDPDLDKKFGNKTEVTVSEILNNLVESNTPFADFVKALQENIGELGNLKVQLVLNSHPVVRGLAGVYSSVDNTIYINRNASYKGKDGRVDNTVLHEIVHAIVANSLNTQKHREELGKLFDEAKEKILNKYNVNSFDELPENLRKGRLYGLSNLDEFAAEFFTNSEFISELNDENIFGKRSDKQSLFSRLVEWIKSLLPKGVTETYKRSGEILEDILLNSGGTIQASRTILAGGNSAANTQNTKLSTPESPLQVYSDGSDFKGTGKIGYGSVFELSGRQYGISGTEENEEVKKLQQQFPEAKFSNPTMEMLALATTLEYFANRGNGENIVINQDYKGACNYQGLWEYSEGSAQRDPKAWKAKEPYIKHLVDRSVAAIEKINQDGGSVKINWVKGHQTAGTEQARMNDAADRYAKNRDNSNTMDDAYPKQQTQQDTQKSNIDKAIKKHQGFWSRLEAQNHPRVLYVFTDNIDRDSGFGIIIPGSWYSKKYGVGHHYPSSTAAVIRGLNNARPISTMHYFYKNHGYAHPKYDRSSKALWHDSDVEEFKKVIRDELKDIVDEFNTGKYDTIMFPSGDGLFNAELSDISKYRTPELYKALVDALQEFGFDSLIPKDAKSSTTSSSQTANQSSAASGATSFRSAEEAAQGQAAYQAEQAQKAAVENTKPELPQSDAFDTALKVTENRTTQFYQTFTPQQIKDRGTMIADYFSDIIDDYIMDETDRLLDIIEDDNATEEEKENARTLRNLLRDPINGRQYVANKIQIGAILDQIKDKIKKKVDKNEGVKKQLWQNTLDFFDEIFNNQASLEIEEQEGIRIVGLKTIEKSPDDVAQEEKNDGDDETGHTVSGNDGWLFQTRFEDPASSLSKRVRRMLYNIKRSDEDKDDLGHTRKYSSGQIYATLLSYLAKTMQNPDDFMQVVQPDDYEDMYDHYGNEITKQLYPYGYPSFPVLEKMREQYPWVEQIINRLTDDYLDAEWNTCISYPSTYGAMASQFYTNFRKVFIPYAKIQVGDGKFGVTPLNTEMEARCQKDKLAANFNNGIVLTDTGIYNQDTTINREHAKELKKLIKAATDDDAIGHIYSLYQDMSDPDSATDEEEINEFNDFVDNIVFILNSFGISSNRENVIALLAQTEQGNTLLDMMKDLHYIADTISKVSDENAPNFNYFLDLRYVGGEPVWGKFFEGRGMITDESYMQSFYDSASKKTRYSYSADNYLQKTFRGLYNPDIDERRKFIDEHFKKYEWFYNHKNNTWRNKWLEHLYNAQDITDVLPYRNINNITEEGTNAKVRDYSKWTPDDVWLVQNRSYDGTKPYTYYLAPIFSDSPMSMTVRGPVLNNTEVLDALVSLVDQELWRIKYVTEDRAQAIENGEVKEIANFDGRRGKEFCFIPELNTFTFENGETLLQVLQRMKEGKDENGNNAVYTAEDIDNAKKAAILQIMSQKATEYIKENSNQYSGEIDTEEFLRNYMNMVYANASIIQLTTVDLAFYKTDVDFQKRFKEVYAGGIQLNTNSRFGKKTENVILLSDDIITSPSYTDIANVINRNNNLSEDDKKHILGIFTDINVADAQAIRAMHSFRSVMDMMGRWDERCQEALDNFEKGVWRKEDFDVIYQTIKPFVYTVIDRNDGMGGVIPVPQQHKNSEICALMMYSLITNNLNSPVYRALSRFMETKDSNGEYLIDMAQFESAGKVGNQGIININYNPTRVIEALENEEYGLLPDAPNTLENVDTNYNAIKKQMDKKLTDKKISQEEYNKIMQSLRPTEYEIVDMLNQSVLITNEDGSKEINPEVVHTIPFDNYYQAQPTPAHHVDAEATFGSQARNIAPADLPDDFEITLKVKGGKTIQLKGKDAVIDFYYELLDENLIEDFFGDGKKKGGLKEVFASKKNLFEAVTEIVRGNPKYGKDFLDALKMDSDGNFTLSPNCPTMFTLMQELITSLFKNRITKQKINGAALIQAAGIGLDENLRLVKDKKGNIIGAQCLMPLTSKEFFEPLLKTDEEGRKYFDVNDLPEELRKAVGYRIPTENKSSMLPLYIAGFTPQQNGSAIILPAEITALAGSDFDVDKMFIMLSSFYVQKYDNKKALDDYEHETAQKVIDAMGRANIADLDMEEVQDEDFKAWFKKHREDYKLEKPIIKPIKYDWSKTPKENGRKARNNMLVQIIYNILTSEAGNQSLLNPQGFDDAKAAAKLNRIIKDPVLKKQLLTNYASGIADVVPPASQIRTMFLDKYKDINPARYEEMKKSINALSDEDIVDKYIETLILNSPDRKDVIEVLLDSSLEEREKFIKEYSAPESPIYPQTFAHSHARNMAGSNQIGIYAIQASMAAKYQRANVVLKENQRFKVNGRVIKDVDVSDGGKRLKNCGQMVGASADNGKDPILSDAGSTSKTAPIIGYMLRLGLTHEEAVLIINQPIMEFYDFNADSMKTGFENLPAGDVSTKTLVKGILSPMSLTPIEQQSIEAMCYRILKQAQAMEGLTMISRADSPNGAMQNSFAKARVQQYMVELFNAQMKQPDFPFYPIKEVINNTTIDVSKGEEEVRKKLKEQPMAFLHAMYALGVNSINDLASPYFFMLSKQFDDEIVKPILYNQSTSYKEHLENLVDSIYLDYITYAMSASSLFGEEENADGKHVSMKSKRDYYLKSFAEDFAKTLQNNEKIRNLLGSILQRDDRDNTKIVLKDVGSLAKGQKDIISRRFDALMALGEEGQKLAKQLLLYAYYDSGLNFTHNSYSSRLSTYFLVQFPAFRKILQDLGTTLTDEQKKNFIRQYMVTHKDAAYNVKDIIDPKVNIQDDIISVNMNDKKIKQRFVNTILSPDPRMTGEQPYPYISYDGNVYELDADAYDSNPAEAKYRMLENYPTDKYRKIYNANKSLAQLADEYNGVTPEQKPEEPSIDADNHPDIGHNTSDDNPVIDNSRNNDVSDILKAPDSNNFRINNDVKAPEPYNDQKTLKENLCVNSKK